jgi:protein SCO1/2
MMGFRLALTSALLAAGIASARAADFTPLPQLERVMVTAPKPVADFEATDDDGKAFKLSSLQGQPALLFFGFAHCPDVCPAALQKLSLLRKSAPKEMAKVRVVMISVDGDRDTPESMHAYLAKYSPDFIGLVGTPKDVRRIAADFSASFFKGQVRDSQGNYNVEHTSRVYALDRKGRLRAELYDASVENTASVVRALLAEGPIPQ